MTERLDVYLYGGAAAKLHYLGRTHYRIVYNTEWQRIGGPSLSLSLPTTQRTHTGRVVSDFLDNLLPDSTAVREDWARQSGLSDADPFHLLAAHGADVAGALEFYAEGEPVETDGAFAAVSDDEIAGRIRAIRENRPVPVADDAGNGRFSLGGAQGKFALALRDGNWFDPTGIHPSTHIFKPKVTGLANGEIVEHITMTAMSILGLASANTQLVEFANEHTLMVERFDRQPRADGTIQRIHQEDMAQALGIPRLRKYEKDGGPNYRMILQTLDRIPDRDSAALAKERFAKSLVFSWLVLNTDAHAKNYSLQRLPESFDLTDMYDVSSLLPYVQPNGDRSNDLLAAFDRTELSMKIASSFEAGSMSAFEWSAVARDARLDPDAFLAWARLRAEAAPAVFQAVASTLPEKFQTPVVELLLERIALRGEQAASRLDQAVRV